MVGRSNAPPPPPPAGGEKSRGPAGRGLINVQFSSVYFVIKIHTDWCKSIQKLKSKCLSEHTKENTHRQNSTIN